MQYKKPNLAEQLFNKFVGIFAGSGIGPSYLYLLEFKGRKTGKIYRTPVYLMPFEDKQLIVAPRGETQWVRNIRKHGKLSLKRGNEVKTYLAKELDKNMKAEVIKAYLLKHTLTVRSYFPITPDADISEFKNIAHQYPIFEARTAS